MAVRASAPAVAAPRPVTGSLASTGALGVAGVLFAAAVWAAAPPVAGAQWAPSQAPAAPAAPADAIAAVDEALARALARIEQESARSAAAERELATLGDRRAAAAQRMRARARALYRITRAGMLPLAGGFEALLGHLSRVERLERMLLLDAEETRALARRGQVLRAEVAQSADAVARARAELRALEEQKAALAAARQTDAALAAALGGVGPGAQLPVVVPASEARPSWGSFRIVDDDPVRGPSFALRRGSLASPVSGDVRVTQDGSGTGGLLLEAAPGSAVRAVEGGRVVFAGRHGEQGLLVVVDHGERYASVYGGLASIEVSVGDAVGRGSRLGTGTPAVRFDLRQGTRSLDARAWLGL